jgi:hypothetical protein
MFLQQYFPQHIFCWVLESRWRKRKRSEKNQNANNKEDTQFSPQGISEKCIIDPVSKKHAVHNHCMTSVNSVKNAIQKWWGLVDAKPLIIIHGGRKIVITHIGGLCLSFEPALAFLKPMHGEATLYCSSRYDAK